MSARVLILEDMAELRRALERFVARRGFETTSVDTVAAAVEVLEREGADLLISDIELPDGSGVELTAHLARQGHSVPTILITGLHDMALAAEGMKAGAVEFLTKPLDLDRLAVVMDEALERARRESAVRGRAPDAERGPDRSHRLVGRHPSVVELFKRIGLAAAGSSPVLIRGESGSGKELVAREIHRLSRPGRPFVALNCASLPDSLLESELFGHARGAFTGAVSSRRGRFEIAGDGTLFLDEIGDASPAFQASILRALQEGEFVALGSERTRAIEARFVAATHRPLEDMVAEGSFREDLFYRIQVLEIAVPPLRERASDLPDLAAHVLARAARRLERPVPELAADAMAMLARHPWPGNVRELENVLERALMRARGGVILAEDIVVPRAPHEVSTSGRADDAPASDALGDVVRRHVQAVLERADGNKREAARRLDISPGRLYRILEGDEG